MSHSEPTWSVGGPGDATLAWRERLGRLGLGTAQLGNLLTELTDEVVTQLLDAAWDAGIRYFDTAPHYGLGLSEQRLGRFLASRPREQVRVSSKVGRTLVPSPETADRLDDEAHYVVPASQRRVWDFTESGLRAGLEASLTRLGLDRLDIVYLHDPELAGLADALRTGVPALVRMRDEGLVGAIGIGSMNVAAVQAAVETGALDVVMLAGRYTLLEPTRARDLLDRCAERGVAVVAAGVFNSGVLASSEVSAGTTYEYEPAAPDVLRAARGIAAHCAQFSVELPTAALQFPLRHPAVSTVVAGAMTADQVRQNVQRIDSSVPEALWHRLAGGEAYTASR